MASQPTNPFTTRSPSPDPFDALLTLEDTLYTTAYDLGVSDGAHAGRIEGRIFGLEKGFEKFASLGELHGRSVVWGSRLPGLASTPTSTSKNETGEGVKGEKVGDDVEQTRQTLPNLSKNERLQNNTTLLHSLTDPLTFDTANTEEGVADFDDRFKRAGAKAKVIERIVGEADGHTSAKSPDGSRSPARGKTGPMRVTGQGKAGGAKKGDDSIEDFAGSKLLR
ncbi:hypothetical protein BKA58DRAFT_379235 [Alternaria rosae]|uniref:uncharacterized protein n=1 Tax=Alternaria rosae TaxID=1187941 RepID=UPI001E8DAE93|nr:uncharacterized protein BKA58DRAFT_379235 [Alternaria rosae]KAH6875111.1 hypothetical protein BKA58DRAFT_379235 [Alternaria rosae]